MIKRIMNVQLFKNVNEKEIAYYLDNNLIDIKKFSQGETVAFEGDECLSIGLLLEGRLIVENVYFDGSTHLVRIIEKNEMFGDALFLNEINNSYPATIIADTDVLVGYIDFVNFKSMLFTNQQLQENFFTQISNRVINLYTRIKFVSQNTTIKKLIYFLLDESNGRNEFSISLSQTKLANYLCTSRMSLHRSIKELETSKILSFKNKKFKIINREALIDLLNN